MSQDIVVRTLNDSEFDAWNRLNASSPSGSIYSTPAYLDCLCRAAGGRFEVVGAYQGDELRGGIGLYRSSTWAGEIVSNRLLLYYNGPILKEYGTKYPSERTSRRNAILSALVEVLSRDPAVHVSLHCRALLDARPFLVRNWNAAPMYTYVVDLRDIKGAWDRVAQNLRRLIKRCASKGVRFSEDDDFDSFYDMHMETHHRKGASLYLSKEAYRRFVERLRAQNLARLFHARLPGGKSAASQLVLLGDHPVCHTVCAGAVAEHLSLGTTPFLRWRVFEKLAEMRYAGNDLTNAWLNDVARFKGQLGGDLEMNLQLERPYSRKWRFYKKLARFRSFLGRA
jgi:hypothetical protein